MILIKFGKWACFAHISDLCHFFDIENLWVNAVRKKWLLFSQNSLQRFRLTFSKRTQTKRIGFISQKIEGIELSLENQQISHGAVI